MDEREKEIRSRRSAWHLALEDREFVRASLSPKRAYSALQEMPETVESGPDQRAVLEHAFDPETMFLRFHGVGAPGDGCTARLWGVEKTGDGLAGRYLCDMDVRLCTTAIEEGSSILPPGTRFSNHVEITEDMAPMPGVLRQPRSGERGIFPTVILGGWGYAVYVLEMALIAPEGVRPMTSCNAMWRAWTMGPPPKITPEMLRGPDEGDIAW